MAIIKFCKFILSVLAAVDDGTRVSLLSITDGIHDFHLFLFLVQLIPLRQWISVHFRQFRHSRGDGSGFHSGASTGTISHFPYVHSYESRYLENKPRRLIEAVAPKNSCYHRLRTSPALGGANICVNRPSPP